MGTYVSGAIALGCAPSLTDIAAALSPRLTHALAQEAILSRMPLPLGGQSASWYAVMNRKDYTADESGQIGEIVSSLGECVVLWVHHSDSTGFSLFKLFERGKLLQRSEATTQSRDALSAAMQAFIPVGDIREPEDLVDLLQASDDEGEAVWIVRNGLVVDPPGVYSPQSSPRPQGAIALDREFIALRPLRSVFRMAVWALGAVMVLGILFVLLWYLFEVFAR